MAADPLAWMRRAIVAIGSGVLLAVVLPGAALSLLLIPIRWYQMDREVRHDPERCPLSDRFARTEVHLGGWAEPDSCGYYDAQGREVQVDGYLAGPVVRRSPRVAEDGMPAAVAGLFIVACVGGLGFSVLRMSASE
jgi:hypothetical protein